MTDIQAQRIKELREQGYGYRIIAQEVGIDRDRVRYFCKSRGLGGQAKETLKDLGIFCTQCKKRIKQNTGRGRRKRFCSEACKRAYWKEHADEGNKHESALYHITCECCNKEFVSYGDKHRKFCSRECYIKARFWDK